MLILRIVIAQTLIVLFVVSLTAQRAVERPSQISRDLQEISLILDEVTAEEREFKNRLAEYNDDLQALRNEIERLPHRSRERIIAAEKYERIFSEALSAQYEFLHTIKQARDRTVRLLERVIDATPAESKAVEHISEAIADVDHTLSNARMEIEQTAVLIRYSSASPEEQDDLARAMLDIEQNKVSLYESHREFLKGYQSAVTSMGENVEVYRTNLRRMLDAIRSRSRIVDVAMERIRTVAQVQREFAIRRHDFVELDKSLALLQDMLQQAHVVDKEMNEFWTGFSPDFILGEVSVMPEFDPVEPMDFELGRTSGSRRDRIDPQSEAQRILERK